MNDYYICNAFEKSQTYTPKKDTMNDKIIGFSIPRSPCNIGYSTQIQDSPHESQYVRPSQKAKFQITSFVKWFMPFRVCSLTFEIVPLVYTYPTSC